LVIPWYPLVNLLFGPWFYPFVQVFAATWVVVRLRNAQALAHLEVGGLSEVSSVDTSVFHSFLLFSLVFYFLHSHFVFYPYFHLKVFILCHLKNHYTFFALFFRFFLSLELFIKLKVF